VYGHHTDSTTDNLDKVLKPYMEEYQLGDLVSGLVDNMDSKEIDKTLNSFNKYGKALGVSNYDDIIFAPWEELENCGSPKDMPGYQILQKLYSSIDAYLVTHDVVPFKFIVDKWGYYFATVNDLYDYLEKCQDYWDEYYEL
jgi:hypothetical protein